MNHQSRISKGKKINPTYFVFCEGETEEVYINHLRSKYRLPIDINSKIAGNRITEKYISNYKKGKVTHTSDKTFLLYDLDVPEMLQKLLTIKDTVLLCSNPCFELWYLLHFQEQSAEISSVDCCHKLESHYKNYKKGVFDGTFKSKIEEKQLKAIHRAKKNNKFNNPSSKVYLIIEDLDKVRNDYR